MARNQPLGADEVASTQPLGATEGNRTTLPGATEGNQATPLRADEVDQRLRQALQELQLAERNAVLWFAEVLKRRLFRDLGFSSIYQYAGEALGFSRPRTAQFIRLCESLEGLPALKDSVAAGEVAWTKAREVAKVATPQTESAWVDLARRESRRQLERRVRLAQTRGRSRRRNGGRQLGLGDGERPLRLADEEGQPGRSNTTGAGSGSSDVTFAEVPVTLSLRFTPEQYARYEAILEKLRKRGERAAREELVLAGLESLLVEAGAGAGESVSAHGASSASPREGESSAVRKAKSASAISAGTDSQREAASDSQREAASDSPREAASDSQREAASDSPRGAARVSPRNLKPVYQIVVQQCEDCGRARVQTSRGAKSLSTAAAEAMRCDARVLRPGTRDRPDETNRSGDRERPRGRNRATIPPAVRREVMARDRHRCRAPGCGSARFLEVHHVVPRANGGTNRPDNLVTMCSACHRLTHALPQPGPLRSGALGNSRDHPPPERSSDRSRGRGP